MNFHVINLGCKVNRAESDTMAAQLLAHDHQPVDVAEADVIIINTCTVTGDAEKKTRKAVRRALRDNAHARVLVTGCASAIDPEFYRDLDPRISVVDKKTLTSSDRIVRAGALFPLRASVKVQDGCDHACTYCIVHVARGKATSRPLDQVIDEVRDLESAGIREVMLSGIDLGSYHHEGLKLDGLLEHLLAATTEMRFRVSSVEPRSLSDRTIDVIARAEGRICRHLHIPLQSGSTKVLAEMHRPYSAASYRELVEKLYEAMPTLTLSTDIIVGFPGESDDDFAETLALAREARFSKIHGFRYSPRQGTPAAVRSDQIDPHVKDERLKILLDLADELREQDARARIGRTERMLVELPGIGTSESYHKVALDPDIATGSLVELTLTGLDPSCMMRACKKN